MTEILSAGIYAPFVAPALLFLVGIAAGVINVMAGSGSALTLPALIFSGLDGAEANGTNRLSILIQNISASASFSSENTGADMRELLKYSLFTLPGMVCGVLTAVTIDDLLFKQITAVLIIVIAVSMFLPSLAARAESIKKERRWLLYLGLAATGFYGGFIQVGIGIVIMAVFFHLAGGSIASVNARKVFIVMIYTAPALCIFFFFGNVDIFKGLNLAAGSALGGWWGAKMSVKKGAGMVRYFIVAALVLSGLKLFGVL
ncbi:MAG: sulfite exporter TauE/SafE family protein [Thermodesulfobacteriota bacterium]